MDSRCGIALQAVAGDASGDGFLAGGEESGAGVVNVGRCVPSGNQKPRVGAIGSLRQRICPVASRDYLDNVRSVVIAVVQATMERGRRPQRSEGALFFAHVWNLRRDPV